MKQLFPIGLGLFAGIFSGGLLVKAVLPWHPLPGWVAAGGTFLYMPFFLALVLMVHQAVGGPLFLGLLCCIIFNRLSFLFMGMGLLGSKSRREVLIESARLSFVQRFALIGAVLFAALWLSYQTFVFQAIEFLDLPALLDRLKPFDIALIVIRSIQNSILTAVFTSGFLFTAIIDMYDHEQSVGAAYVQAMNDVMEVMEVKRSEQQTGPDSAAAMIQKNRQTFIEGSNGTVAKPQLQSVNGNGDVTEVEPLAPADVELVKIAPADR